MGAARRILTNTWTKARVAPEQLLAEPSRWAALDYATVENPNVRGDLSWAAARPGTAHGLCVWFDTALAPGVGFSNAPGAPELIYGSAFFPWPSPVALDAGDSVAVALRGDLVGDDYVWCWGTRVLAGGHPARVKASFKQSTFFGAPLSAPELHKRSASHVPTPGEECRHERFILALMDGQTSLGEIARRVSDEFPERFPRWQDALTAVGDLSVKYCR
jgi:protein arginine N-methyltransferase 1